MRFAAFKTKQGQADRPRRNFMLDDFSEIIQADLLNLPADGTAMYANFAVASRTGL